MGVELEAGGNFTGLPPDQESKQSRVTNHLSVNIGVTKYTIMSVMMWITPKLELSKSLCSSNRPQATVLALAMYSNLAANFAYVNDPLRGA